jgi:hypothetical protein
MECSEMHDDMKKIWVKCSSLCTSCMHLGCYIDKAVHEHSGGCKFNWVYASRSRSETCRVEGIYTALINKFEFFSGVTL